MEERQINKWLCREFAPVGWTILIYYGIMNIMVICTMIVDIVNQTLDAIMAEGIFTQRELDMDAIMGNAWGYMLAIAVGLVILYAWKGGDYWRYEMLKKEKPMKAPVFFLLAMFLVAAQLLSGLWITGVEWVMSLFDRSVTEILEAVTGDSDTVSMFLYASILAPISEEILFRGYVLRSLRPYGKRFAIFSSALLFAIFHGNLLQIPYAFLAGLVLGYAAAEYSIFWAIVLHMFNNFLLADLLTRLMEAVPPMVGDIISSALLWGCALGAAVVLIKKRREIRAYQKAEWMDRRCIKCLLLNGSVILLTLLMAINAISMLLM